MHGNILNMFDSLADPVVYLLLLESSTMILEITRAHIYLFNTFLLIKLLIQPDFHLFAKISSGVSYDAAMFNC